MKAPSPQSLFEMCCIRNAYLLLCRNKVEKFEEESLVNTFQRMKKDIGHLPLPKSMKPLLESHAFVVFDTLLSLVRLWFPYMLYKKDYELLTGEMLYECLVLNGDGLIDPRKTAQKLLRSRMLDQVFAFRLACMNFLEKEVLKLWICVKQFFLKKIFEDGHSPRTGGAERYRCHDIRLYRDIFRLANLPPYPCTTEPPEVLFWIGYCLSKENGIDIKEVPHFAGNRVDWYQFALESAAYSCNVACFDYFRNFRGTKIEYNCMETIEKILFSKEKHQKESFIFHFRLLDSNEKADMFQIYPHEMVSLFLQWPLSLAFMEDYKSLWDLIPDRHKHWIFFKIFALLFHSNASLTRIRHMYIKLKGHTIFRFKCPGIVDGLYNLHHLERIWIDLWKISSDSHKLTVLNSVVFESIEKSAKSRKFCSNFNCLKEKLCRLFLERGERVLELYKSEKLKESLMNLVSKYMSKDSEVLNRDCISFLKDKTEQLTASLEPEYKVIELTTTITRENFYTPVHKHFFNYIQSVLLR